MSAHDVKFAEDIGNLKGQVEEVKVTVVRIDSRLDSINTLMANMLNQKADKGDMTRLADRLVSVEKYQDRQKWYVAGMAAVLTSSIIIIDRFIDWWRALK